MKAGDMSIREYKNFYNLGELRRKLRFIELDRLGLKYLDPLRNELDARLAEYSKPATNKEQPMNQKIKGRVAVSGHRCLGHWTDSIDCGRDFDCEYGVGFGCDDCVFVVGFYSGDYRRGKRPWSKKYE